MCSVSAWHRFKIVCAQGNNFIIRILFGTIFAKFGIYLRFPIFRGKLVMPGTKKEGFSSFHVIHIEIVKNWLLIRGIFSDRL